MPKTKKVENIQNTKGTIANILTAHQSEIYDLINTNQYQKLQSKVMELLDDPALKENPAVPEAKVTLSRCAHKQNLYYSTLMTYMTGMKVSY